MNFNRLYLFYYFTKSYVRPLVSIVSMRRSYKWSNIGFSEEMNITEIKISTLSGALIIVFPDLFYFVLAYTGDRLCLVTRWPHGAHLLLRRLCPGRLSGGTEVLVIHAQPGQHVHHVRRVVTR